MQNLNSEKAFAKVNISLNILNKRNDGYHNLNSDVIFANIYDSIQIKVLDTNNKNIDLKINGRFKKDLSTKPKTNIVYKAALYFMNKYNCLYLRRLNYLHSLPFSKIFANICRHHFYKYGC